MRKLKGYAHQLIKTCSAIRELGQHPRAVEKSVCIALGRSVGIGLVQRDFSMPMAETRYAAVDQTVSDDLISFLNAIPEGVSPLRRNWPLPAWSSLPAVVPAAGGSPGDPEGLPQLP